MQQLTSIAARCQGFERTRNLLDGSSSLDPFWFVYGDGNICLNNELSSASP